MRNLLLLTFSASSPSYLLSSDAIISFLPSLLRRFVRTEEEPAKMMKPTGFFPRGSSRIAGVRFSGSIVAITDASFLSARLTTGTSPRETALHHRCFFLRRRRQRKLRRVYVRQPFTPRPRNSSATSHILKKGEWTVCSIHTSKKQKKSQQIHKKEEASIDSD
ncbi:hypothetical protein LXL04_038306 [Taraxacum kok-saghyz]